MVDRSAVGRKSKNKGSQYELSTAKKFTAWWGHSFHRVPASGGLHWSASMNVAGDIITTPEADFPFVVECKKREDWTLENAFLNNKEIKIWWSQVVGDARETGKVPILVFSRNRAEDFIMLPYNKDFVENFRATNPRASVATMYVEYVDELKRPHGFTTTVILLKDLVAYDPESVKKDFSPKAYSWESESMMTNQNGEYEKELEVPKADIASHVDSLINRANL